MKQPLKWAGSKLWLALQFLPGSASPPPVRPRQDQVLVELFAGGASLSFTTEHPLVILSDINYHLIAFYRAMREGQVDTSWMRPDPELFLSVRKQFNELSDSGDTDPEMFYYLVRSAYNGLCRFSKAGGFNAPYGLSQRYEADPEVWRRYTELMRNWSFATLPWQQLLGLLKPGHFVYADPPFPDSKLGYYGDRLTIKEHIELAKALGRYPGTVLASNSPILRDVYEAEGFSTKLVSAPRSIAASGDRTPALELLAWKVNPTEAMDGDDQLQITEAYP